MGLELGCAEGREGAEIGGVRGCGEMRVEIVGGVEMKSVQPGKLQSLADPF